MYTISTLLAFINNNDATQNEFAYSIAQSLLNRLNVGGAAFSIVHISDNAYSLSTNDIVINFNVQAEWVDYGANDGALALNFEAKCKILDRKFTVYNNWFYDYDKRDLNSANNDPIDFVEKAVNRVFDNLARRVVVHNRNLAYYAKHQPMKPLT